MLDILRIRRHLKELRKRLFELESHFKPLAEEKLVTDETLYNAAEHHLQIAIQNCLDIASYIVAVLGLPSPKKEASEVFFTLVNERIISLKTANIKNYFSQNSKHNERDCRLSKCDYSRISRS